MLPELHPLFIHFPIALFSAAIFFDALFILLTKPENLLVGWWVMLLALVSSAAAIATGIGGPGMTDIEVEVWDKVMNVNVRGTWLVSKASVPHLAKCGNGKILNLASDTALWGATNLMHYVASKGAVVAMTRSMANELGEKGISVNCIAPGLTEVEATEYVPEERKQLYRENRSLKRTQMPSDITGSVIFFMSDASDFITGQCLPVNGGFVMN